MGTPPVPVPDHPFHEAIIPNIHSKLPLEQPEAVSSCLAASSLGEEINPHVGAAEGEYLERAETQRTKSSGLEWSWGHLAFI